MNRITFRGKPRRSTKRTAPSDNGHVPSELLDQVPPHNLAAEKGLLGSIFLDSSILPDVSRLVQPAHFYAEAHQILYWAFLDIYETGGKIDVTRLVEKLKENGTYDKVGGAAYLAEVFQSVPYAANWPYYAEIVRKKAAVRNFIGVNTEAIRDAWNEAIPFADTVSKTKRSLAMIDQAGDTKERFLLVACAALDAKDYTPQPIITDCLYAGHPAIDGGMYKTLKTLVAIDGAISISSGRPFLNTFTIPKPMGALYFIGEGGPSMVQEYARRVANSKGLKLAEIQNLQWCFSVPRLEDLHDLDAMTRVFDDTKAKVAFIDNLMLALTGDEAGNVFKMGQILGNVIRICAERNITPVFVHHFKRTRAMADGCYTPGELSDLTQAGAAEIAGQWWLLTRREKYDPDDPGEHRLWLNVGGRLGHGCLHALDVHEGRLFDTGGRRWEVAVLPTDKVRGDMEARQDEAKRQRAEERAAATLDGDRSELVKILTGLTQPETKTVLRSRAPFGRERFERAFGSLTADNTIRPVELTKGKGNHPYEGWRLRTDGET